jgi:hypothetical protein
MLAKCMGCKYNMHPTPCANCILDEETKKAKLFQRIWNGIKKVLKIIVIGELD